MVKRLGVPMLTPVLQPSAVEHAVFADIEEAPELTNTAPACPEDIACQRFEYQIATLPLVVLSKIVGVARVARYGDALFLTLRSSKQSLLFVDSGDNGE